MVSGRAVDRLRLQVSRESDIYLIAPDGSGIRRFTSEPSEDMLPSWSPDSRWIFFTSNRGGTREIWKAPPEGGTPFQVTRHGAYESFASSDGQTLITEGPRSVRHLVRSCERRR